MWRSGWKSSPRRRPCYPRNAHAASIARRFEGSATPILFDAVSSREVVRTAHPVRDRLSLENAPALSAVGRDACDLKVGRGRPGDRDRERRRERTQHAELHLHRLTVGDRQEKEKQHSDYEQRIDDDHELFPPVFGKMMPWLRRNPK